MVDEVKRHFHLRTNGSLSLAEPATLESLEAFCAEARRLGVNPQQQLLTTRQGLLGPVTGFYFTIPVAPSKVQEKHG